MTRRTGLLLGLVVAVIAAVIGAVTTTVLVGRGSVDCPVPTTELSDEGAQLVPVDELLPAGSVRAERRPVVSAVDGLGGPFGPVVSGRFYEQADEVPSLVPAGDALGLATADSVHLVDVPGGAPRWGRSYDAGAARGGVVGDDFVVLVGGPTPAVVSVGTRDGAPRGCVPVPMAAAGTPAALLTDQAGADVVVVAAPRAAPATLSRVDPAGGQVRWERRLGGVSEVGSVTVAGTSAVVSRVSSDPVRLAEMAAAGGIGSPMVTAYSLADGTPTWSFPAATDVPSVAATVLGHDERTGTTLVLTAVAGPRAEPQQSVVRAVALDDAGAPVWRQRLGRGFWDGSLWGSLLVVQGPDARGGALLRAFAAPDGAGSRTERWTLSSRTLPGKGDRPRTGFGAGVAIGDGYVLPAPNGLVLVDPGSGTVERLDSTERIDQVLPVGEVVVVRAGAALLVVERRDV